MALNIIINEKYDTINGKDDRLSSWKGSWSIIVKGTWVIKNEKNCLIIVNHQGSEVIINAKIMDYHQVRIMCYLGKDHELSFLK